MSTRDSNQMPRAELPEALPEVVVSMKGTKQASSGTLPELGEPMGVGETARLLGCSAWTVRQKYVRRGLPCFRTGPSGRLTFYKNQVVAWILERQQEQQDGGNIL